MHSHSPRPTGGDHSGAPAPWIRRCKSRWPSRSPVSTAALAMLCRPSPSRPATNGSRSALRILRELPIRTHGSSPLAMSSLQGPRTISPSELCRPGGAVRARPAQCGNLSATLRENTRHSSESTPSAPARGPARRPCRRLACALVPVGSENQSDHLRDPSPGRPGALLEGEEERSVALRVSRLQSGTGRVVVMGGGFRIGGGDCVYGIVHGSDRRPQPARYGLPRPWSRATAVPTSRRGPK